MVTKPASTVPIVDPGDAREIVAGTHGDPFSQLGLHVQGGVVSIRAFVPDAERIDVVDPATEKEIVSLAPVPDAPGLFAAVAQGHGERFDYRLRIQKGEHRWTMDDPYRFGPVLGDMDEHLISEGAHRRLWEVLGSHVVSHEGTEGTHFAVWAPNARRVSVVGDFNGWDGRRNLLRRRGQTGVWEIFMPGIGDGEPYKYELLDHDGRLLPQKSDPFGFGAEHPPKTASIVRKLGGHEWSDAAWMFKRDALHRIDKPISIYEVHLGSWKRVVEEGGRPLSYREHAEQLVAYARDMGFAHIELMPVSEFPFDGSWGYQPVGLYAPTVRYGTLEEFRAFVEACHAAGLGLILDWVPGHYFPEDQHGLGHFDGTSLYEHADPKEGFHPDWKTLVYNYGRREVSNYLIANALYWMREHHVDGLRVDAVAPMVIEQAMNRAIFESWIEQALVPALPEHAIVVMDNLSAHKGGRVAELIEARGGEALYLPPYSPDLNPIEQAFAKLKHWLRTAARRTTETLWDEIGTILSSFRPAECANFFSNAGYRSV